MYTIFLCAGSLLGGLTGGYIGFGYSWASVFWVNTAVTGFTFLGVVFFLPETYFERARPDDASITSEDNKDPDTKEVETVQVQQQAACEPYTYLQSLQVNIGKHPKARESLLHYFIQPWRTLALPGTWVVMLHYAGLVGGVVTISLIGPQLVSMPPYLWGANAGLINLGGLIGALIGYGYTFVLADWQLKRQAKKQHHGVAEAEDRLPTLFFPLFVATSGFFVFGFSAQYPGPDRWVGLEFGAGMVSFGLTQVPSVGFNYVRLLRLSKFHPLGKLLLTVCNSLSILTAIWLPTVSPWSPFSVPSSPLPGHSSLRLGCRTAARRNPLASSGCSWVSLAWWLSPCGCSESV